MPIVEFLPEQKKIHTGRFANLRGAAVGHGVPVCRGIWRFLHCRGNGICGACAVRVVEGKENLSPRTVLEKFRMGKNPDGLRLSCQAEVLGDVKVVLPLTTAPSTEHFHQQEVEA